MASSNKELFIHAIQMIESDGNWNIPTAVLYRADGNILIGNAALAEADYSFINEDFKIELGQQAPGTQSKRKHRTAAGDEKSAAQIANDFLYEVQKFSKQWLLSHGIMECRNIVVAEPLSMHTEQVSPDWLINYRATLRRVLEGKTIFSVSGVTVKFIPEPFAVFQYYRHGIRHPLVAQQKQMYALVIDFGGGTCDVCIIETTKEGDISGGGRNKRPLAGKSFPVGGYTINRAMAEALIRRHSTAPESQLRTALREYKEWHDGKRSDALDQKYKTFIENFNGLVHRVETLKLSLARSIGNWSLEADGKFTAPAIVPADPFERGGKQVTLTMSVSEFRDIFIQKIWVPILKPFFGERLKAGVEVLQNTPLTVVLLSGGSANLGWLRELLRRDYPETLGNVQFVQIPDYQQVVAQGLAVDCAREFTTGTSDFKGVTYNPLFLLLDADESGCEPRAFKPRTAGLPAVQARPGLLLPSASLMESFIDKPMEWRVKLNRTPNHKLEYFFLQNTLDPTDVTNRQNVEETVVFTPAKTHFDDTLQVQLTLRHDGTATPKFVYQAQSGRVRESAKEGRPFFIDMTDASSGVGEAYLGLDFGTSNTAISYIDRNWVQLFEQRQQDASWRELGDLVELLPAPLALPLARYVGDVADTNPVPPGISFLEASLCLAAYVSYAEYCSVERRAITRLLKGMPHRSTTYLWHLLKELQLQLGEKASITRPFHRLLEVQNAKLIDEVLRQWAGVKHEKVVTTNPSDLLSAVKLMANVSNSVFQKHRFGFFQGVQRERLSNKHSGRFRIAHGKPPYGSFALYSGTGSFSESDAFVVDLEGGSGLPLAPLVFWYPCQAHMDHENGHCFFFDKAVDQAGRVVVSYKATGHACTMESDVREAELGEFVTQLQRLREQDGKIEAITGLTFTPTS